MSARALRARVLLEEARVLGVDLADLIAADVAGSSRLPTVADYIEAIAPTFTSATAATCRPYWRLTATHLGGRRLAEITLEDLVAVGTSSLRRSLQPSTGTTC